MDAARVRRTMSSIEPLSDAKVIDSWQKNAEPWTGAVRGRSIETRKLVTDAAVVDAVMARSPSTVLDIGCGEGWLARALSINGVDVVGVDVVPALIDRAALAGGGDFRVASYEDIALGMLQLKVDVVVANFAFIGHEAVDGVVERIPSMLNPGGALIIQTLHPVAATGDAPYEDGWRKGTWQGFTDDFIDPAPWYFRTIGSWIRLLIRSGLSVTDVSEPIHPNTGKPASLILTGVA